MSAYSSIAKAALPVAKDLLFSKAKDKVLGSLSKNNDLSDGKKFYDSFKGEFDKKRAKESLNPVELKEGEEKPGFFSHKNESVFSEKGLTKIGANAALALTTLGSSLTVQLLSSYVIDKAVTQQMKMRNETLSFIGNTASSAYNKLFGDSDKAVADTSNETQKMSLPKPTPYA